MWLSVAFPTCPQCGENSNKCFHRNCPAGAKEPMEINADTAHVRCPSCKKEWHIMDSNYFCSCDYVFSADDVSIEVNAIVANAKLIAQEIKRATETQKRINAITNSEIEITVKHTIRKTFGDKLWETIKSVLPAIVTAVRAWLNI